MEIRSAYSLLALPTDASRERIDAAFSAEQALLDPIRLSTASPELQERAAKRLQLVTEAYRAIIRNLEFGGKAILADLKTPVPPHSKYDIRYQDPAINFTMPKPQKPIPKLDLNWMYFVVGIGFLVLLLFSKSVGNVLFYFVLAVVVCIAITAVKISQKSRGEEE